VLWDYCHQSARMIFGTASGDPLQDEVLERVREKPGITGRDLHKALGGHTKGSELVRVLATLRDRGEIHPQRIDTGGRRAEMWYPGGEQSESCEQSPARPPRLLA